MLIKFKVPLSEFTSHLSSEVSHAIDLKAEMTSRTQSIPRSHVVRIIDGDDELKNIA